MRVALRAVAACLLLGAGVWVLADDVPGANAVWYVPAWYGYLLLLDAMIAARTGLSFLSEKRRELLLMLFGSLPFWFFFEACNLRLHNWYYVFGLRSRWAGAGMAALAFATVLPACLLHAEVLEAWGAFREKKCRPWHVGPEVLRAVGVGGLFCAVMPLLLPGLAFPLIWFAPIGLEALNYRMRAPSLLRDFEEGRCRRVLRLLAAGLWAGIVWELFNSWARCKWIYTVPGFETAKIFEMPVAGFLGFPVLAVGGFVWFSSLRHLLINGRRRLAVALLAFAFCAAVDLGVEQQTVRSRRPLLVELTALDALAVERLKTAGIPTPERLVRAAAREDTEKLARSTGIAPASLERAVAQARLAIHKGMGVPRAALLEAAGVESVAGLAREEPDVLQRRLAALAVRRGERAPAAAEIRVWVDAARRHGEEPSR